ncbi:NADH dehydrogenase [ubiquinone] 1 beta subcomplex subunit 7 [Wickerhamomyces ciferrii]|uniref:NADH dehydrogenase [ubiquinone] 1 beta subcomplex subunit 7 n=1 Tax=Wickerhamomyces ciferrii (strain ATCC 14091 / BCRC 22168 / CBS 111 / JCM 3599 / NBRC 0793 / NRRL Y-1031 F-60-10) TaxID=1206466 RepID=K0KJA2_WICCF|nr:NADH dehydrogenase [ubiquinone] 1 beta subcomplex subunit 7 [Wickerhamomyces ciferrii]CCH43056.1 NADH dehydrogenase [ubiquinone] 1 beta subcomplex subunit 7 [Wickerhamomyces ciferrii]
MSAETSVDPSEMREAKIPLAWRDRCAALWIPLEKCRRETYFLPWKCTQLRHDYEQCQYLDFQRRVKEMDELKELKAARDRETAEE